MNETATEPKVQTRRGWLIAPGRVRQLLLDTAQKTRAHKFTRVSADTLNNLDARLRALCAEVVRSAPSKGKTL